MELAVMRAMLRYIWYRLRYSSHYNQALAPVFTLYEQIRRAQGLWETVEVFGARATRLGSKQRLPLGRLVRRSATPPWKGKLLYEIIHKIAPQRILELGTHVGFGTAYLAMAAPHAEIHTIEASPALVRRASQHFRLLGIRPTLHIGTFEHILPRLTGTWDVIYIDGDHRGRALLRYGLWLAPRLTTRGILICDDIFWSRDMYKGWRRLVHRLGMRAYEIGPLGILYS